MPPLSARGLFFWGKLPLFSHPNENHHLRFVVRTLCVVDASLGTPEATISWPSGPRATLAAEASLRRLLILSPSETGRGRDLPVERRDTIQEAAIAIGLSLSGAMSLRRQLICATCRRGTFYTSGAMGSEAGAKNHADATETAVGDFLSSIGVSFETEAAAYARGARNTPDFRINATINGRRCFWIDVKTYYGSGMLAGNTDLPVGKLRKQVERYNAAFGPGAFVFLCGVASDFPRLPGDPLMLDATPCETSHLFDN